MHNLYRFILSSSLLMMISIVNTYVSESKNVKSNFDHPDFVLDEDSIVVFKDRDNNLFKNEYEISYSSSIDSSAFAHRSILNQISAQPTK